MQIIRYINRYSMKKVIDVVVDHNRINVDQLKID